MLHQIDNEKLLRSDMIISMSEGGKWIITYKQIQLLIEFFKKLCEPTREQGMG